jgi:hypothetical protein
MGSLERIFLQPYGIGKKSLFEPNSAVVPSLLGFSENPPQALPFRICAPIRALL